MLLLWRGLYGPSQMRLCSYDRANDALPAA